MRMLLLKHFDFDDPSAIVDWARRNGHDTALSIPTEGFVPPPLGSFDWLLVLGGPMSAYEESKYSWLRTVKSLIRAAVDSGKHVLGICLGAQMLAETLGGTVSRNKHKEIGWHPVKRTAARHPLLEGVPETFHSFHWHGDCFDIPASCLPLAYSDACRIQAFAYGDRTLGLQFHLETSPACMETMLTRWRSELVEAPYIQPAEQILGQSGRSEQSFAILHHILDRFVSIRDKSRGYA